MRVDGWGMHTTRGEVGLRGLRLVWDMFTKLFLGWDPKTPYRCKGGGLCLSRAYAFFKIKHGNSSI